MSNFIDLLLRLRYELDYLTGFAPQSSEASDQSSPSAFAGRTTVESSVCLHSFPLLNLFLTCLMKCFCFCFQSLSLTSPSVLPDLSRLNISDSSAATSSLMLSSLGLTSPSGFFPSPSPTGSSGGNGGFSGIDEEAAAAAAAATAAMVASDAIDSSSGSSASLSASDLNSQLVDFQLALQPYLEHFTVGLHQNCPPEAQDDLLAEGCPKCLQTSDVLSTVANTTGSSAPMPCVVMRCQQLECQHVVHANCLMNNASYMPTLHRYHSTNFFRSVPVVDPSEVHLESVI